MNRALLRELQRQCVYPSVTLLMNTRTGASLDPADHDALLRLVHSADIRLDGDVPDEVRIDVVRRAVQLVNSIVDEPPSVAIAVCVSPHEAALVRLGREVRDRCVIDDTFATRDMVADVNRTAVFRVITLSDRKARLLVGNRNRLIEVRSEGWPLLRDDDQTLAQWSRAVSHAMRQEQGEHAVPTVLAGVDRSIREILKHDQLRAIGIISGNHDRTGWDELHDAAWPLVVDWLRSDHDRATRRLDAARSAKRYAGGIDEVWELARDGRVELLVVEESFDYPARLRDGRLEAATDAEAPDVIDDAVDELIEAVLQRGGEAVIVPEGQLERHERLAAVLRY
jgi:hypothetical protein